MNKKAIAQIAFEFISIVFAVMLALGLNSFKQSIDAENEANKIKRSIVRECRYNLIKLDSTLILNEEYASYLDSLVQLESDEIEGLYFAYEFQLLTNSAWQLSQNNSVTNNLEEDFLITAADIYQMQSFYQDFSEKTFQNIGLLLARQSELEPSDLVLSMYYNLSVINNTAQGLKNSFNEFLSQYETPLDSLENPN